MDQNPWKVLVVDDDEGIHSITRMVFRGYEFENRPIQLINASSSIEAKRILAEQHDIAVTLLDVVMETDNAGLNLVNHIRKELNNTDIRVILRTGHPGFAPETEVIIDYDINDYLSKAELSASRLLTSVVVALRSYRDIQSAKPKSAALLPIKTSSGKQDAKQRLLEGFSLHLNDKIQPLLDTSHKLSQFSHKPMVNDLISQLNGQCQHLFEISQLPQPVTVHSAVTVNISEQIGKLVNKYLAQAKAKNWIIDYDISPDLPSEIKLDLSWLNTLLITLFEIAVTRADTTTATEFFICVTPNKQDRSIINITITGQPNNTAAVTPWQEVLLIKLEQLSKLYSGSELATTGLDTSYTRDKQQILSSYSINL